MARFDRDRSRAVPGHWPSSHSLSLLSLCFVLAAPAFAAPADLSCPSANCTASDLQASISAVPYASGDDTCSGPGDTIEIEVTHVLNTTGGSTRYDIGLFVANDGGADQSCWVDILETGNSSGSSNLGEQDACRDLDGDDNVTHTMVVTVPCVDVEAPFGELDPITIWRSWANNDDQVVACTVNNVIEGTDAKCAQEVRVPEAAVPGGFCGDDIVSGGEQCDDGNNVDGDGCSAQCISEVPTVGEWGLGALGVLLLAAGALAVRRGGLI
jgi:cysteine-rich repeat protein